MAGSRKFGLSSITRDDISGLPCVLDVDKDEVEKIPKGRGRGIRPTEKGAFRAPRGLVVK